MDVDVATFEGLIERLINNAIFRSKRGQLRLGHTPAQSGLRGACFAQALEKRLTESVDVIGSAVGQGMFDGVPGSFDGVELGSVRGQAFEMQPRILPTELTQGPRIVNGSAVPHHDDVTTQVTQQVPEEIVDLVLRDVLRMHPEYNPSRRLFGLTDKPPITEMRSRR